METTNESQMHRVHGRIEAEYSKEMVIGILNNEPGSTDRLLELVNYDKQLLDL